MRRLLIADVHANLPAFEAVLRDAGAVDETIFLGDVVGFGPHPAECVDLLQSTRARAIAGNHDYEVLRLSDWSFIPGEPVNWSRWTRRQLIDAQVDYLERLPAGRTIAGGEIRVIHHPSGAPYLHPQMPDAVFARHFRAVAGDAVFFAHSHRVIDRTVEGRRLVCIPSVGQPRDGDPRAGYALESGGELSFHRVAYDVEAVAADVRAIGLDPAFTSRWIEFLRTGFDEEWSRPWRQ
jgi:diadenosine tetraphosphatase ApaH/serine/threonine PP2A family protein phosphatase